MEPKIGVLEESEQRQVHRDRRDEAQPAHARVVPAGQAQTGEVGDDRGRRHEGAEAVVPGGVEQVTGEREPDVAVVLALEPPEHEVGDRQKREQKQRAVEQHLASRTGGTTPPRPAWSPSHRVAEDQRDAIEHWKMPEERVELSWGWPRRVLSPVRLPFRHSGVGRKYRPSPLVYIPRRRPPALNPGRIRGG